MVAYFRKTKVFESIKSADKVQTSSAFSDISYEERITLAELLLRFLRTGSDLDELLDEIDPDCSLSAAAEYFLRIHLEEPVGAILGLTLSLITL